MEVRMNAFTTEKIKQTMGDKGGIIKLFYDAEDCGCNGVLVLQVLDQPYPADIRVQDEPLAIFIDRQQAPLFDDIMNVEADPVFPVYKVASDDSVFSTNVPLRDLRKQAV
ncbi:iron-sulfur cluster biosynthesis family protein [Paenibacillus sp. YN15]|uniref:iron-sulfur cluster biosynthesis family protein n=1 Tax=Paenibacillus sp. YN15 TaxID=1742774 RepID=UPI000DCEDD47|nr:iron-sulfur cluster biosynthesis family protein [Paenibacillus sp. YN15]RAV02360.1 iron-sulfur cluster biosynthesis family protein [Paenibacillus sp. YN15]